MPFLRSVLTAVLMAVLALPTGGQAQSVKVGLHAGGHLASLRGTTQSLLVARPGGSGPDGQANWGRRTGIQAGAVVQIGVRDWAVLQSELNYVQKGATATVPLVRGVEMSQTTRYDYLEFPVLAKLRIPTGGRLAPAVLVGPSLGLNFRAESEAVVETQVGGPTGETQREPINAPGTELGAMLGGEVAYVFPSGNALSLEVRYSRGLSDISPAGNGLTDTGGSVQSEVVSLGIGYVVAL